MTVLINRNMPIRAIWIFYQNHKHQLNKSRKVEKISEDNLNLISSPSPSVKIQIMGGKVCFRCKGKKCWALSTSFLYSKNCWQHPAMFCLLPQVNFPANELNFHWRRRWWDQIQAIFLNLFYFTVIFATIWASIWNLVDNY